MSYHMSTFSENTGDATATTKPIPNPAPMAINNFQSISLLEAGPGDGSLLEFVLHLLGRGDPHNPSLPSNEVGSNDWSRVLDGILPTK